VAYVEFIHDSLVSSLKPFDEPIDPSGYKDSVLLDSAINRPFQTFDGKDLYESLAEKGAALFHSLVCNHCFSNGNKRTGLIALDLFLIANEQLLLMNNIDAYHLAKRTAEANSEGRNPAAALREIAENISTQSVTLEWLRSDAANEVASILYLRTMLPHKMESVRSHPLNVQNSYPTV
jgi:death on curing protein